MKTFLICLFLLCLLSISSSLHLDKFANYSGRPTPYACTGTGFRCERCRDLIYCSSGTETILESCQPGQICNEEKCIAPPTKYPPCNPLEGVGFICSDPGMFPDPTDCKQYIICTPTAGTITATPVPCEGPKNEYAYNPKTYACDKKLPTKQCETFPIPLCTKYGEVTLTSNPNIYYECKDLTTTEGTIILYPYQKRCENGKKHSSRGCR